MNIPSGSMRSSRMQLIARFVCLMVLLPGLAAAHGLLLDAKHVGDKIEGTVYYSNGELAVRESVELLDLSTPRWNGCRWLRPTATASSASRSRTDIAIACRRMPPKVTAWISRSTPFANARPTLDRQEVGEFKDYWVPPAWAVIGLLLLASLVPVAICALPNICAPLASRRVVPVRRAEVAPKLRSFRRLPGAQPLAVLER